jgi:hypothetical protein
VRSSVSSKLTYANVMSTIAVVLAVGGGATALALTLPKNSVHSKQIAKGAVKTSDIGKDAVTGDKVKEGSLGKVPLAVHADSADTAGSAGTATNATHAASADALTVPGGASISPTNVVQAQNVSGYFTDTDNLELDVKGFGRFWLDCKSGNIVAFNLSTPLSVNSPGSPKAVESGVLVANEFPLDLPPEVFPIDDTPEGGSSEYGTQGHRLYVHFTLGVLGSTKTMELDGGGFDVGTGCIGQLHASVSG